MAGLYSAGTTSSVGMPSQSSMAPLAAQAALAREALPENADVNQRLWSNASAPLPDHQWDAWFQSMANQGVNKIGADPRSAAGSNQMRGYTAQPQYSTTGNSFMGRKNNDANSLSGLRMAGGG